MATFTAEFLSGSTDGIPINIIATASPGTTVHTAHASAMDNLHLYAVNAATAAKRLTVEFGSSLVKMEYNIPHWEGPFQLTAGYPLSSSAVCRAFASASDIVFVGGYVARRTT